MLWLQSAEDFDGFWIEMLSFLFSFAPVGNPPLPGLDLSLFTVSALHQILCHSDDVIQQATPTRQLSQEVLEQEVNVNIYLNTEIFYFEKGQSQFGFTIQFKRLDLW